MEGEQHEDNDEPEDVSSICQLTALFYDVNSYHNLDMILNFYIELSA
jgi:hypothetical protein